MLTKTARVIQLQGITFAGTADSNHWVVMDGPKDFGGQAAAARPKELVLIGLAGCTASDVASILKKQRAALERLEINVTAEEREEHPRIYTHVHLSDRVPRGRPEAARRRTRDRAVGGEVLFGRGDAQADGRDHPLVPDRSGGRRRGGLEAGGSWPNC